MKKKWVIVVIIAAIFLVLYLATRNLDLLEFLKRLHGG